MATAANPPIHFPVSHPDANLHPVAHRQLGRAEKEALLGQRARVFWLCGLSGSGKSTLALALERSLHARGRATLLLDGDNLRTGLNRGLGFTPEDRAENLRRAAEVARIGLDAGLVVIASFITPTHALQDLVRTTVGRGDIDLIHVRASFEACAGRDPKGLYAKAATGAVGQFTGRDQAFEEPATPELVIDTEVLDEAGALAALEGFVLPRITAIP